MRVIIPYKKEEHLAEAATALRTANKPAALTGAGISVGSGIPDFRSPGGLWTVFSPEEYATLEVFFRDPAKAWELYRALGKTLLGKKPNPAHQALAEMAQQGWLQGIVTQNIDNLHQQAGSSPVFEIHGDHQHLQCLQCDNLQPAEVHHYQTTNVPRCGQCGFPLKPNVVLFGEDVRDIEAIHAFIADCDLLLVIGTSAQVYPAAALPSMVRKNGGRIFEFNREQTLSVSAYGGKAQSGDFFFQGDVGQTLPMLTRACHKV
jgi:NAD-dependent deacetylase